MSETLQEMYSKYAGERIDGGKDFTLEDHLHQARQCRRLGITPAEWAQNLGVPVHYTEALFAATEES